VPCGFGPTCKKNNSLKAQGANLKDRGTLYLIVQVEAVNAPCGCRMMMSNEASAGSNDVTWVSEMLFPPAVKPPSGPSHEISPFVSI
jgi:hypothetical protein